MPCLCLGLILTLVPSLAAGAPVPLDLRPPVTATHQDSGPRPSVVFPELTGWKKGQPKPLPNEPNGYSLAYDFPDGITATVYVYQHGVPNIPDDVTAAPVKADFAAAKKGVEDAVKFGLYKAAKELSSGLVPVGKDARAPRAYFARFEIIQSSGAKTISDLYVTTFQGFFIKFRFTRAADALDRTQPAINDFLDRMGTTLKR